MNLEIYQKLCMESKILWTQHCLQRMQERNISRADVKNGIVTGEIIEDYPDDYPNPSCLIFGYNIPYLVSEYFLAAIRFARADTPSTICLLETCPLT